MTDCPICFIEDYTSIGIVELGCGHKFCLDCIRKTLKHDLKCPMCRSVYNEFENITVTFPNIVKTLAEAIGIDEMPEIRVGIILNEWTDEDDNLLNFTDPPRTRLESNHHLRELVSELTDTDASTDISTDDSVPNDWFDNPEIAPENNWFDNQDTPPFPTENDNGVKEENEWNANNPHLVWGGEQGRIGIYAPNYNVFRIMSGMGGLHYAN